MTFAGTAGAQPLLPGALRRPTACLVGIAALVFTVFAVRYQGGSSARWLDRKAMTFVGTPDPGYSIWNALIALGHGSTVVMLALLLSALALALGHRRLAALAIVGPGSTGVATMLLKPLIGRTMEGTFAYPSGHAGGATALGIVAALLLIGVLRTTNAMNAFLLTAGTLLPGGVMAIALVADQDHYATDTVGGICLAVTVVLASALAIEWCADHIGRRDGRISPLRPRP